MRLDGHTVPVEVLRVRSWRRRRAPEWLNSAAAIIQKYADQRIGVADAAIVVLAQESGTATIATLDRRHFSVLRLADGSAPQIVP